VGFVDIYGDVGGLKTADDFAAFTTNEIQADSALKASDQLQPIPKPSKRPPVLALE
jgi:hypothetical protein